MTNIAQEIFDHVAVRMLTATVDQPPPSHSIRSVLTNSGVGVREYKKLVTELQETIDYTPAHRWPTALKLIAIEFKLKWRF